MSCKQKSEIFLFVCIVTVAFYKFQICDSVTVGRLNNLGGFGAYQSKAAENIKPKNDARPSHSGGRVILRGAPPLKSDRSGLPGRPSQPAVALGKPPTSLPKLDAIDNNLVQKSTGLFWTSGNATRHERPSASDNDVGYQADFPGFRGVQGKVLGLSFDSSPHFSEWLAMRPLVQCDNNIMTFTASGHGHTHLLVDREGTSPISLFQLPSYCGYSVRTSWRDLVMMVPYEGCYITQENGNYVLPMLWFGSPLKLSCPVQMPTPAPPLSHSATILHCSLHGMIVQIHTEEDSIWALAVMVNGEWAPFVSSGCAYRVDSQPDQLIFFIPVSARCVTVEDVGLYLLVLLGGKKYTLSCPVSFLFPFSPPLSPGDPQYHYFTDPVTPAPTTPSPPQPPTQEQILQFPDYFHYLYPGLQYPQLPLAYPPGPQPARPSQPTPGSPPGPQSRQSLYPVGPGQLPYSPGDHLNYPPLSQPSAAGQAISAPNLIPGQDRPPYHLPKLPVGPPQYPSGLYFPYVPLDYPPVTPAPTHSTEKPTTTVLPTSLPHKLPYYPQYYPHVPYYPSPTAAPVTQRPVIPTPPPPPKAPKQPISPQFPDGPFYPPGSYNPYYPHGPIFYPKPGPDVWPPSPHPLPTTTTTSTTRTMFPKQPVGPHYSSGLYYPHRPSYFPLPSTPPAKGASPSFPQIPQHHLGPLDPLVAQPTAQQAICPPYAHSICSHYPYPHYHPPYPPHYHPFYPPIPLYPSPTTPGTKQPTSPTLPSYTTTTTTSSVASTPTQPTPQFSTPTQPTPQSSTPTQPTLQSPSLQCLKAGMIVFLPSAHPDSIQIRDQRKTWLSLSSVSPLCGYVLKMAKGSGVILHSPLPACHSQPRTPTTLTLPLRFWDLAMAQYRTLELQCSYQPTPETPAPDTTTINPITPSTTQRQTSPSVPRPKLVCFSQHMTVELPPGPISGIVVKDIKGNQINLQDAPEHCGYTASKGKNGKISLNFPLGSHCHMSVEGNRRLINIVYMTVNGRREAQLSCPVSIPVSGQECNLPSEQRLPCGPSSLSQPKCLSMGCCFSKRPPACYYPMDECTVDRHFVFSVPASLTEPPLSPALLVAAGNSTCKPQKVTSDYALFKIPLDGCGARRVEMGKMVIYIVEILSMVKTITLNYGTITRDSPVRLLVECRYLPGSVVTVGFLVKGPSLGPAIHSQGVFGVQLRLAKDAQYSNYYPQYHQPLQMLLGKPLYLEVRLLNPPDPNLVLLVHYCVAYPRSGQAVWVLLYNGCPNPLDPAPQQGVLSPPPPPSAQGQTRRFTISTFQFLPAGKSPDLNEEIYFMCSTEVCSSHDGPCVEGCFGQ